MADHVGGGVGQHARELIVDIGGQHDEFRGPGPYIRLVLHYPVARRGLEEYAGGVPHADEAEQRPLPAGIRVVEIRLPLVQPEYHVPERDVVFVQTQRRVPYRGHRDGDYPLQRLPVPGAQLPSRAAQAVVIEVRLLLRPAGIFREIRFLVFLLTHVRDGPVPVHQQRPRALGADIEG
jgi:hypothetical protein